MKFTMFDANGNTKGSAQITEVGMYSNEVQELVDIKKSKLNQKVNQNGLANDYKKLQDLSNKCQTQQIVTLSAKEYEFLRS